MLIKIINGNKKSDWTSHTGKKHIEMLLNPPEYVEIRIEDFYPHSPDKGKTEIISFILFNLMARDFFLKQQSEKKKDKRNLDTNGIDDTVKDEFDLFDFIQTKEDTYKLYQAMDLLSDLQKRRVVMYFFDELPFETIAEIEGVTWQSIQKAIKQAIKKLKKVF